MCLFVFPVSAINNSIILPAEEFPGISLGPEPSVGRGDLQSFPWPQGQRPCETAAQPQRKPRVHGDQGHPWHLLA